MKILSLTLLIFLIACKSLGMKNQTQMFTTGKYLVLKLNEKTFSEKENYQVYLDTSQNSLGAKFDCNQYSVQYKLKENNEIEFGFPVGTKMYCEGEMAMENNFFGVIRNLKYFDFKNGYLKFYDENKELIIKLKKLKS